MGYNPTGWNTRRLEDFAIPLTVLLEYGFKIVGEYCMDDDEWDAKLEKPEWLWGADMDDYGVDTTFNEVKFAEFDPCSNSSFYRSDYEKIEEMLKQSVGLIEYVLTWEGGDSIAIHTWKDGVESTETIV